MLSASLVAPQARSRSQEAPPTDTGKIRHHVNVSEYGFGPDRKSSVNRAAIQKAISEAYIVEIPATTDAAIIDGPVELLPLTILRGAGAEQSRIASEGNLTFVYEAPNGGDVWGPAIEELGIYTRNSGIRLNRRNGGFSADGNAQMSIMRPRISRVKIFGERRPKSVGIDWNKVFDGVIDQCEIADFALGLRSLGSDLCELRGRSRIWRCEVLAEIDSIGSYGSGFILNGCDLLNAGECFLRSSDGHLQVIGCYFETYSDKCNDTVLDLAPAYVMIFQNNRFETPRSRAPQFLRLKGEAGLFAWENNFTLGEPWGDCAWNEGLGARYWRSVVHRQQLIMSGSSFAIGMPFITEPERGGRSYREAWRFSPSCAGLNAQNYGSSCRVQNGAFVLPPLGTETLIRFSDPAEPLEGKVAIRVRAWSRSTGQRLDCMLVSNGKWALTKELSLDQKPRWYQCVTDFMPHNLEIQFQNRRSQQGDDVFVSDIVVEQL